MKKLLLVFLVAFATSSFQLAFALPGFDAGSINGDSVRDLRLHEAVTRARAKQDIVKKVREQESEKSEQEKLEAANQAYTTNIKSIVFVNNNAISSRELYAVIQKHINEPMSIQNVSTVRKEIMKHYQKKGFYSAVATVSSENSNTGELVIDVKEGGRNSITVE